MGPSSHDRAAIAAYLGLSDEQRAYDDYRAVVDFTGSGYVSIREAARNGKNDPRVGQCEDFIANAPQWGGGETRRGVNLDAASFANIQIGQTFPVNGGGPASWSTSASVADSFAGNSAGHSVVFIAKNQRNATSIRGISNFHSENEVLVSMRNQYRVISVTKGHGQYNNRTYVEVEVV